MLAHSLARCWGVEGVAGWKAGVTCSRQAAMHDSKIAAQLQRGIYFICALRFRGAIILYISPDWLLYLLSVLALIEEHSHTLSHTLANSLTHSHKFTDAHTRSQPLTLTHCLRHCHTCSQTPSHTLSDSHSLTLSHSYFLTHFLSISHSLNFLQSHSHFLTISH